MFESHWEPEGSKKKGKPCVQIRIDLFSPIAEGRWKVAFFPPRLVNGVFNSPCHGLRNSLQLQALQKWLSPPLHLLNVRGFLTCPSVGVKGPVPDPGVCVRNILQWAVMVSVLALILSHFLLLGKFLLSFEFAYALELIISFSTYLYVPIRRGPLPISWVCQVAEVSHRYLEKLELLCDGH